MRRHRENDVHSAGRSALRSPPKLCYLKTKAEHPRGQWERRSPIRNPRTNANPGASGPHGWGHQGQAAVLWGASRVSLKR